MVYLFDYHTVKSAPVKLPPAAPRAPVGFTLEQLKADAKRCRDRQVKEWNGGDRVGSKYASDDASVAIRRAEWMSKLTHGAFDRHAARACLGIHDAAADHRIDTLERAGLIKRLPVRPLQWERAE